MMRLNLSAAFLAFALAGCGSSAPRRPETGQPGQPGENAAAIDYLKAFIVKDMKSSKAMGLSIAIVDDKRILWSEGFGLASKAGSLPAAPSTIYRIGSTTKFITAAAILKLQEQGKVDIDSPLTAYLPDFRIKNPYPDSRPITLRNLLTHHSGMPRDYYKGFMLRTPEESAPAFARMSALLTDTYRIAPADSLFAYSNLGYALLGQVIAKVGGTDYPGYIRDSLFAPLGMDRSSVLYRPDLEPHHSKIRNGGEELPGSVVNIRDISAGSVYSSVEDMAQFMQLILGGGMRAGKRILREETVDTMLTRQNAGMRQDEAVRMGLGCLLPQVVAGDGDTLELFDHGGLLPPFSTAFQGSRTHRLGVVVMSNGGEAQRIAREAMLVMLSAMLGKPVRDPEPPLPGKQTVLDGNILAGYCGSYGMEMEGLAGSEVEIKRSGEVLGVVLNGKRKGTLTPTGRDSFILRYLLLGFIPYWNSEEIYLRPISPEKFAVGTVGGGTFALAEKRIAVPVPAAWREREGHYVCINPDTLAIASPFPPFDLIHSSRTGTLHLRWSKEAEIPLRMLSEDEAVSYGRTTPLRASREDGREILEILGYRFERRKP
jgi:CubicO group peptidase (beta-lactamase class C family)